MQSVSVQEQRKPASGSTQLVEVALPDGLPFSAISESDARHLYAQVFAERIYERHGLVYPPGAVVVDIGANIGMFLRFAALQTPAARYIGIEPIPSIFAALEANGGRFTQLDQTLLNMGLAECEGEATFDFFPNQPCCSTMHREQSADDLQRARAFTLEMAGKTIPSPIAWTLRRAPRVVRHAVADWIISRYGQAEKVTCPLATLSQIIDRFDVPRIDLLKIDAERAELGILRGIEERHWPLISQTVIEVHWSHGPEYDEILGRLKRAGFQVTIEQNPDFAETPILYCRKRQ
jgi:FkbM family methyltransferase